MIIRKSLKEKSLIAPDKKESQKKNIAVLDGVRAIACLTIIAYHINLITISNHVWQLAVVGVFLPGIVKSGYAGVTLFFVLSGFLLFMPYAKALLFENQWPSMRQFYVRRAFRIFPAYYVSLFLMIVLIHPEYLQPDHWKDVGLFLTFLMDSTPQTFQKLNGPFWTLAVEWQYYMILPFLALGFGWVVKKIGRGSLHRRWWALVGCLMAMICWGITSRIWGPYFSSYTPHHFPPILLKVAIFFLYGVNGKFLEDFAVGMLVSSCYILSQQIDAESALHWIKAGLQRYSQWLWGAGILTIFFITTWNSDNTIPHSIAYFDKLIPYYPWFNEFGFATGFGLCILALLFGPSSFRRPLEWTPLRWLGLISYSLYIWHLPILIDFIDRIIPLMATWKHLFVYLLFWLCALFIAIPFSCAFYLWIEQPWIRIGNRKRRSAEQPKSAKAKGPSLSEAAP